METVSSNFLKQIVGDLTLAKLIEAIREGEEWTKRDMAKKLGVLPSYYSDFLKGNKVPSIKRASDWADTLQYSKNHFVELAINDKLMSLGFDFKVRAS